MTSATPLHDLALVPRPTDSPRFRLMPWDRRPPVLPPRETPGSAGPSTHPASSTPESGPAGPRSCAPFHQPRPIPSPSSSAKRGRSSTPRIRAAREPEPTTGSPPEDHGMSHSPCQRQAHPRPTPTERRFPTRSGTTRDAARPDRRFLRGMPLPIPRTGMQRPPCGAGSGPAMFAYHTRVRATPDASAVIGPAA